MGTILELSCRFEFEDSDKFDPCTLELKDMGDCAMFEREFRDKFEFEPKFDETFEYCGLLSTWMLEYVLLVCATLERVSAEPMGMVVELETEWVCVFCGGRFE